MIFTTLNELLDFLSNYNLSEKIAWLENQGLARGYKIPDGEPGREFLAHEVDRAIRAQFADLPYVEPEIEGGEQG